MATLNKTGNTQVETKNNFLKITPLSDLFSKEKIKSLGFPDDLNIVFNTTELVKQNISASGKVLSESKTTENESTLIVSQENLDLYFEQGQPLKSFFLNKNENLYFPFLVNKEALEECKKTRAFKLEESDKIYGTYIKFNKLKDLQNIKKDELELVAFIKTPYRSVTEHMIQINENEFVAKAKHIYGTSYLNSDKYELEQALPELIKQQNIIFIRKNPRAYGTEFLDPKTSKDFSGILQSTPHYNQNDAGDLLEVETYFLPSSELLKQELEWVKPESDNKKIQQDPCFLIDDFQKDPKYKDKFAYPCIEDVILLKHLGMFPFNKFMETPAVAVEPEKVSPLNKFL